MWQWLVALMTGRSPEDSEKVKRMAEHVDRIRHDVMWLREMHSRVDEDGVPLWYVPRGIFRKQQKMLDSLNEVSHTLKEVVHILDKVSDKISRQDGD